MYPASFEYHRASSVQDAVAMLAEYGDEGKVLAGGHSLLPVMKLRLATPKHLVDIGRIDGLSGVSESGGTVVIGALTRHAQVASAPVVAQKLHALYEAARGIGDVQVRNRGTIGGSLAHADPGADMPAVMLALGAQIVATGKSGDRAIDADDFFTDAFTTALAQSDLVTQVRIPVPGAGSGSAYEKQPDPASGYAIVGVAVMVTVAAGNVSAARVAVTGLTLKPTRLSAVEQALTGQPANAATIESAAANAAQGLDLYDDAKGTAAYKGNLAKVFTQRALARALSRT
jgi:carbon-monoxide dehydrogenase medium subunit